MSSGDFPRNHVWMYKDAVPLEIVSQIRHMAPVYAKGPNYWLPKECLECDLDDQMLTAAESAIWYLYHSVAKHRVPSDCTGAEWWIQVYEGGSGLAFHFDKDEHRYKTKQTMLHPSFSSVLYLTGLDEDRLRQACTVILDQRFDSENDVTFPESPTGCVFVPPTVGKYCFFDGSLGHGVLDASNSDTRATMLVNWWKEAPQGIVRPSMHDLQHLSQNMGWQPDSLLQKPLHAAMMHVERLPQLQYPVIRIPTEDEDVKECGILVDDLFDAYLLDSFGPTAVQAVGVWYAGHVLYPIDPAKTKQDISKKLIIPAAFIPADVTVGP